MKQSFKEVRSKIRELTQLSKSEAVMKISQCIEIRTDLKENV
jgi:hypothetical protein